MGGARVNNVFVSLVLLCVFLQGTQALRWTQSLTNGSTLYRCVGDDVTLRWSYVTEPGEKAVATFLYSGRNGTLVTRYANRVMTSSPRVTYVPSAGMTLSRLTPDDAGMYGIHVKVLQSLLPHTQLVNLVVLEPPKLTDGTLKVEHWSPEKAMAPINNNNNNHNNDSNNNNNNKNQDDDCDTKCGSGGQLRCGHFDHFGVLPVSVMWTAPDMKQYTSTGKENGYFLLDLPASFKGGNYTCSLVLKPEVSQCLQNNRPLLTPASIFLETTETKVEKQAGELQDLQTQLDQVRMQTSQLQNSQSSKFMKGILDRVQHLEVKAENITRELRSQKTNSDKLAGSFDQMTHNLTQDFHRAVAESERQTNQTMRDSIKDVSGRLNTVAEEVNNQKEASSEQESSIRALQQQMDVLQNQLELQANATRQLRSDLASARSSLDRHTSSIAELQKKLQQHDEHKERQRQTNSKHEQTSVEQQELITGLQSNISSIVGRLQREEARSSDLQSSLDKQQGDLSSQKESSEQEHQQMWDSIQNNTQSRHEIADQLATRIAQTSEECDQKVRGVQSSVGGELQNVQGRFASVDSRLKSAETRMTSNWRNVSAALVVLEREQVQLRGRSLNDSVEVAVKLARLEENLKNQTSQVDSEHLVTISRDVAGLQRNLSSLNGQCNAMQPRLSALESGLERVNENMWPIRLVGGQNEREGRVEIRVGRRWGTVCDDGWDNNDAKVVCNMLGFFAAGAEARASATFGQGTGPIVLDDVNCDGSEPSLQRCGARAFGTHNCQHNEDAGVVCIGY